MYKGQYKKKSYAIPPSHLPTSPIFRHTLFRKSPKTLRVGAEYAVLLVLGHNISYSLGSCRKEIRLSLFRYTLREVPLTPQEKT